MSDLTRVEVIERLNREARLCERIVGEKTHYVKCLEYAIASLKTDEAYDIIYEGLDVIPVPEGATNGDMIKTMFPEAIIVPTVLGTKSMENVFIGESEGTFFVCQEDWWNSPYRKEN